MKPKEYDVLDMAVDNGVEAGWRHAYKYRACEPPEPEASHVRDQIKQDVLNAICEWFDFDVPAERGE
jgi:hypothetical protein